MGGEVSLGRERGEHRAEGAGEVKTDDDGDDQRDGRKEVDNGRTSAGDLGEDVQGAGEGGGKEDVRERVKIRREFYEENKKAIVTSKSQFKNMSS